MGTLLDGQVGFKKQSAFGTPVTVDRFLEVLADSTHTWDPAVIQGQGLRVSSRYPRSARRSAGTGSGDISLKVELASKGFGTLWELVAGTAESNLVSGSTYQQRFRPVYTTPFPTVATIQFGVPRLDASGTVDAYTYSDCVAKSFTIDCPDNEHSPTLQVDFWAGALATATALAAASYTSAPTLFVPTDGATTLGGTLTPPTTTALASGGTVAANIRAWSLEVDLGLGSRPKIGGWQIPPVGTPAGKLTIKQDVDATTLRDALIAQSVTSFTGLFTGAALSTGTEQIEVDIPAMMLDSDSFGQLTTGDGPVADPKFTILDDLTDDEWYIVARTADTAL